MTKSLHLEKSVKISRETSTLETKLSESSQALWDSPTFLTMQMTMSRLCAFVSKS